MLILYYVNSTVRVGKNVLHNIMSVYSVDSLRVGQVLDCVIGDTHVCSRASLYHLWFLAHKIVCDQSDAEVIGQDKGGIIGRGVLRIYRLDFVPTHPHQTLGRAAHGNQCGD